MKKHIRTAVISLAIIGLTVVAFGTSLPELATSVVAALRKEMDISIGYLIGSNVFNLLSVVGVAAMVRPMQIAGGFFGSGLLVDYAIMMITSALPLFFMRRGACIRRRDGLALLAIYLGYLGYLVTQS